MESKELKFDEVKEFKEKVVSRINKLLAQHKFNVILYIHYLLYALFMILLILRVFYII